MYHKASKTNYGLLALLTVLLVTLVPAMSSDAFKPPKIITLTGYPIGTASYSYTVGLGEAIFKSKGVKVRVIPSGTDIGRIHALRAGVVDFTFASGSTSYYGNIGASDFCDPSLGPVPLQLLWGGEAYSCWVGRGNLKAEVPADVKGMRMAYTEGSPALQQLVKGFLSFGGLTWDDVEAVKVPGYPAGLESALSGRTACYTTSPMSGKVVRTHASPAGIKYVSLPHDDKEGWQRFRAICPFVVPRKLTEGVGLSKESPLEGGVYPFHVQQLKGSDPDFAYWLVKSLAESYKTYKTAHVALKYFSLQRQVEWAKAKLPYPYHPGAVKFFRESGVWTGEMEAWNQRMIKRQEALEKAWKETLIEMAEKKWKVKELKTQWYIKLERMTGQKFEP